MSDNGREEKVKKANREFYDRVADVYDTIDGRRNSELLSWIDATVTRLQRQTNGTVLLDLGCGSGAVVKQGACHFAFTYGMDISTEILKRAKGSCAGVLCGEASHIPLKNESVDVVVSFAVFHHLYQIKPVLDEIHRVLKKGGILYSDHDMDTAFMSAYFIPMKIYRTLFSAARKYINTDRGITPELYRLSEIHSDGVDSGAIANYLRNIGFRKIDMIYHWFGLNRMFNAMLGHRVFSRGRAPLISIVAVK